MRGIHTFIFLNVSFLSIGFSCMAGDAFSRETSSFGASFSRHLFYEFSPSSDKFCPWDAEREESPPPPPQFPNPFFISGLFPYLSKNVLMSTAEPLDALVILISQEAQKKGTSILSTLKKESIHMANSPELFVPPFPTAPKDAKSN